MMKSDVKIVFPEGNDVRILNAAVRLVSNKTLMPIILGDINIIGEIAEKNSLSLNGIAIINPETFIDIEYYAKKLMERCKDRYTLIQARILIKDANYFGAMIVYLGKADGMVSGAAHPSSDTIRPALQIIKMREGVRRISGAMLMTSPKGEKYILADIAGSPKLNAHELAEVAIESAKTAKMFGIEPRVAMLSFSTNGSAISPESKKIAFATKLAKKTVPNLCIDGEMQFDAAFVKSIGLYKMPGSPVAGRANVYIFPDLQSGNIAYKIMQHVGGYKAFGPLLQGLNKPINDLSRGCTEEDIYNVAMITVAQVLNRRVE